MKGSQILLATVLTFFTVPADAQQPRSIFYMTREPQSVRAFLAHADKIDILSPSWYAVDSSGLLSGGPNPEVMETARQDHVPVMPLVVNLGFAQEEVHKFFANPTARQQAVAAMVRASRDNGYIGLQLDLEMCIGPTAMHFPISCAKRRRHFTKKTSSFLSPRFPTRPGIPEKRDSRPGFTRIGAGLTI